MQSPALATALNFSLAALGVSCALQVSPELARRHILSVDDEGNAVDPLTREKLPSRGKDYFEKMLDEADRENDARRPAPAECDVCPRRAAEHPDRPCSKIRRILIHIHGGLNSSTASLEASTEMAKQALAEPEALDWHYPIFITWPSGGLSAYSERLFKLRQAKHSPAIAIPTSPFFLLRDLLVGVVNIPRNWSNQGATDMQLGLRVAFGIDMFHHWTYVDKIYQAFPHNLDEVNAKSVTLAKGDYRRSFLAQAGRFLGYWSLLPLKLVTSSLVLDGLGTGAWEVMLHRAQNLFRPAKEFERAGRQDDSDKIRKELEEGATGAFAELLRALNRRINSGPRKDRAGAPPDVCYHIVLVGHSMGAIVINDALRNFQNLPVTRIVYMAPACSIHDAEQCVLPFMDRNATVRFHLLTLHPEAESDEWNAFDTVPRGSLLEWIDNFFTSPTSHTELRLGKWINTLQALRIFAKKTIRGRVTIKAFGVEGDSLPQIHGQFNECPFWEKNFWNPEGPFLYVYNGTGKVVPKP